MIIMAALNLAGGTVRDEGSEADDLSIEDGDAVELFSQDRNLPRLLWRPSPTTPHHILHLTFLLFMSRTTEVGRKSWKAFSVFIFSASSSPTFSMTSWAKTCTTNLSAGSLH